MLADPMRCVRCFSPLLTGCCDVLLLMLLCMCLRTLSCKAQIILAVPAATLHLLLLLLLLRVTLCGTGAACPVAGMHRPTSGRPT